VKVVKKNRLMDKGGRRPLGRDGGVAQVGRVVGRRPPLMCHCCRAPSATDGPGQPPVTAARLAPASLHFFRHDGQLLVHPPPSHPLALLMWAGCVVGRTYGASGPRWYASAQAGAARRWRWPPQADTCGCCPCRAAATSSSQPTAPGLPHHHDPRQDDANEWFRAVE
jgi:hypothetical protein